MTWQIEDDSTARTELWREANDPPTPPEAQAQAAPYLGWLIVAAPTQQRGMWLALGPNVILGRGQSADIRWEDVRLSRRHAHFWLGTDPQTGAAAYFVAPLEARKTIEVNHSAIHAAVRLYENDQILLGDTLFVLKVLE